MRLSIPHLATGGGEILWKTLSNRGWRAKTTNIFFVLSTASSADSPNIAYGENNFNSSGSIKSRRWQSMVRFSLMSFLFLLESLDVNSFSLTMQNFTTSPGLTKSPTALVDEIFEQYADREEPRIPTSGKNLSVQSSTPSEISLQRGHHRDLSSNSASSSATS